MGDGPLFGRDAERLVLLSLLDAARAGRSGTVVVRGEAGLGKTALLSGLVAEADGMRVLATAGVPAEATIPFAGLHQLLLPAIEEIERLAGRPRAALEQALGLRVGPAPEPLLLGAAVLGVLCAAAPVLVTCDDAQWLDAPSLAALAFAARRLGEDGVALVLAGRDELPALGLPEFVLAPLGEEDATALLADLDVAEPLRRRVLDAAAGNPLALVELAAAPDLAGGGPLPVPERLRAVYAEQVDALPPAARRLLLLLAADGTSDARAALAAAADGAAAGDAVAAIEAGGVARIVAGEVKWRHPLAREAVLAGAGGEARRDAHRALASVADADRAAWHRAEAALAPDEAIASALTEAGRRAAARGGHGAAADALARAAQLSPDPGARAARTVEAAASAWSAGRAGQAATLLDQATPPPPGLEAESARIRGAVELHRGSPGTAHRLLAEAAERLVASEPERALRLGLSAMEAASLAGEPRRLPFPLDAATGGPVDPVLHRLAGGLDAFIAGDLAATVAVAELELASGAPDAAHERLHRLVHGPGAHPAHRFGVIPPLVEAAARAGQADGAREDAGTFAAWADATGSPWARPLATRGLALVAATPEQAEALFERARSEHDGHRRPLDRARTDLLAGEQLRRNRKKAEARVPLQAALEVFEAAGATRWAERAREELRAAGVSAPQRLQRPLDRLTPQELRIARLVANGASNRDAGAALYLSPRTVEYHLHKVFKKLGVHSRAELAALLTGAETG